MRVRRPHHCFPLSPVNDENQVLELGLEWQWVSGDDVSDMMQCQDHLLQSNKVRNIVNKSTAEPTDVAALS